MSLIEMLRPWVINIVAIIIFVIIADIVLPEGSIKGFVKVIIGLFVLLAIIQPLIRLKNVRYDFEKSYMQTSLILSGEANPQDKEVLSSYQKTKALEIYEANIKDQIATAVSYRKSIAKSSIKVMLDIDKNHESSEFGVLKSVQIILPAKKGDSDIEKIKKVSIGEEEKVIYKEEQEYNLNEKTSSKEIIDMLSKMFGIDGDKVQVKLAVEKD